MSIMSFQQISTHPKSKEWLVSSAKANYQELAKLASEFPELTKLHVSTTFGIFILHLILQIFNFITFKHFAKKKFITNLLVDIDLCASLENIFSHKFSNILYHSQIFSKKLENICYMLS